jgi:hypothetical protein
MQTRYCRQCGRSFAGVQLALEGRIDEAVAKFKKSEDLLGLGLLVFALTMLGALLMLFFEGPRAFSFIVIFGLIVCVPIVLAGLIKVDRVRRFLDGSESEPKQVGRNDLANNALPARSTDPLEIVPVPAGSVTDRTTLHLDQHKPTTND